MYIYVLFKNYFLYLWKTKLYEKIKTITSPTIIISIWLQKNNLEEVSAERISAVVESKSFEDRKQMYNLLSEDEKYQMWKRHLLNQKAKFTGKENIVKISLIEELIENLQPSVFNYQSSSKVDVFNNYFIPTWNSKAEKIFSAQELYDLTQEPSNDKSNIIYGKLAGDIGTGGDPPDCFCNVGTTGYGCKKTTIGVPSGVTVVIGMCEQISSACTTSSSGCAFLWLSSCNGNHCNW